MSVRKEKNCFSSCYAKTQLSDYVILILDTSRAVKTCLEVPKQLIAYHNKSNEPRLQEKQKNIEQDSGNSNVVVEKIPLRSHMKNKAQRVPELRKVVTRFIERGETKQSAFDLLNSALETSMQSGEDYIYELDNDNLYIIHLCTIFYTFLIFYNILYTQKTS
jgi:hypothetical protein